MGLREGVAESRLSGLRENIPIPSNTSISSFWIFFNTTVQCCCEGIYFGGLFNAFDGTTN
jgi:hypothetical protein